MQGLDGVFGEQVGISGAGHLESVPDVAAHVVDGQAAQVGVDRDPLGELAQAAALQLFLEFRLADQDDLDEVFLFRFQVGKHADFLDGFGRQVLGFVDDQDGPLPAGEGVEQKLLQVLQQGGLVAVGGLQFELLAEHLQKLGGADVGVVDQGQVEVLGDFVDQVVDQSGFAGADFASDHPEALVLGNGVFQVGVGVFMPAAPEQVAGIGVEVERLFLQSVKRFIHGAWFLPGIRGISGWRLEGFQYWSMTRERPFSLLKTVPSTGLSLSISMACSMALLGVLSASTTSRMPSM